MTEFSEVIKQFKRMCWYYTRDKAQKSCPMSTSYPNCNIGQCRKVVFEEPIFTEKTVMAWVAEHPEPVYPTWEQFIAEMYLRSGRTKYHSIAEWEINERIPADIAQKLGIEPKEG